MAGLSDNQKGRWILAGYTYLRGRLPPHILDCLAALLIDYLETNMKGR